MGSQADSANSVPKIEEGVNDFVELQDRLCADVETKLPIQIEQTVGTKTAKLSDIAYDVELDLSLFNITPPLEYSAVKPVVAFYSHKPLHQA